MSNVLIGIIGVILFIGLALAGALFLGPRFQEASTNSKASAQVSAMKQLSDAVNMYELQEGQKDLPLKDGAFVTKLATKGYLKSDLTDALGSGTVYWLSPTMPGKRHILIGYQPKTLCEAVNRQAGIAGIPDSDEFSSISGPMGCVLDKNSPNNYVVYVAA